MWWTETENDMTDKELLEAAARAFWGDEIDDVRSIRGLDKNDCIGYTHADNQDHNGRDVERFWAPLTDDGDALRLAVKLNIGVGQYAGIGAGFVRAGENIGHTISEPYGLDCYSATRRAIVRAAAKIGSSHNVMYTARPAN